MTLQTTNRLIDCVLIKGRLINALGTPLRGTIRAWIPGQHRGKVYNVLSDGKFKVKIHGYKSGRKVTLIASSPGYLDLTSVIHCRSFLFRKGQFDGYKVVDGGDAVMQSAGEWVAYTMEYSMPI